MHFSPKYYALLPKVLCTFALASRLGVRHFCRGDTCVAPMTGHPYTDDARPSRLVTYRVFRMGFVGAALRGRPGLPSRSGGHAGPPLRWLC